MFKKVFSILFVVVLLVTMLSMPVSAVVPTGVTEKPTNTLKTNGNGGKTDVGTWMVTYNNEEMWADNFGSKLPINYRALLPDGTYGIQDSSNVEHIDFMLKEIADAKIDFIIFDETNGGFTPKVPYGYGPGGNNWIVDNAKLTCERIAKWNANNKWQIRYAMAIGTYDYICNGVPMGMIVEWQAEAIYKDFVENKTYGKDYYTVDGKPMLILFDWAKEPLDKWNMYVGDRDYADKFFVRSAQIGNVGTYGWHTAYGTIIHEEVEVVCPGHDTAGENEGGKFGTPRKDGDYYKESWEKVLNNPLPRIVVITALNDYNEQTAVWPSDSSKCNEKWEEQWTDKTGKINKTMYWDMTKEGIRLVRVFNGDLEGKFASDIFDLGDNAEFVLKPIYIVIAVAAIVVIAVVVIVIAMISKKKKVSVNIVEEEINEENS